MSTQRFPRTKYVRQLVAMEQELYAWVGAIRARNYERGIATENGGWNDQCDELIILVNNLHSLAEHLAHLPGAAQRRARLETAAWK